MEALTQIIKRLSEEDYQMVLGKVSTDKYSKPYMVLQTARLKTVTDAQMIDILEINPSTYYTLKSRLSTKVAAILSKKVENPISVLMNEISRMPASVYGTDKQVAIMALKELEKQLLEYDLSNELIIVYHSLARLYMYNTEEYGHYDRLYNKFVAFSLASAKAENIFYGFIILAGEYQLTHSKEVREKIESSLREQSNIAELYDSHRLFVFFNIMQVYFLLIVESNIDLLVQKEMEIDKCLQDIKAVFDRYPLDTFYNTMKFLIESLYFEYYQKINNLVRAKHHYKRAIDGIAEYASHYLLNFHIVQFLNAKIALFLSTNDDRILKEKNDIIINSLHIENVETYNRISFYKYQAIVKYYEGNYKEAASVLAELRDTINLKQYWLVEIDLKLFQAFQYLVLNEEILCKQLIGNIERTLRTKSGEHRNIKMFLKLIKTCFVQEDLQEKKNKIAKLWETFQKRNSADERIVEYLQIDNKVMRKIAGK